MMIKQRPCTPLIALLITAFILATPALRADDITPPTPAQLQRGSMRLMRSVQNEANAAMARARAWLVTQQQSNGQWIEEGDDRTGLVLLALSAGTSSHSNAIDRGVARLAATNHLDNTLEAWRWLALKQCAPTLKIRKAGTALTARPQRLLKLLVQREARHAGATHVSFLPYPYERPANAAEELLTVYNSHIATDPARINQLATQLAQTWDSPEIRDNWRQSSAERAWWLARSINRQAYGALLLSPKHPLNWRRDLADFWINRQRISVAGDGYWLKDSQPSISETAFAILLLQEL